MLVVGIRYPHYVLIAVFVHETGRIFMAFITNGEINFIMSAGAFGSAAVINKDDWLLTALLILSGPLSNYVFSAVSGGIDQEKFRNVVSPVARLKNPFAVVNLRFSIISFLGSLWQFL